MTALICSGIFGDTKVEPAHQTNATVRVVSLREGTLPLTIRALGRIAATQQTPASVDARVGGVVTEIVFRDGEQVHVGDVLLRLDARAADANLKKAQSDLAVAEQELQYAQTSGLNEQQAELDLAAHLAAVKAEQDAKETERLTSLLEKKLVSDKAATEARQLAESSRREADAAMRKSENFRKAGQALELERMRGRVAETRGALGQAEINFEAMTVQAPVDAHLTRVHVTVGQTVDPGARLVELEASQGIGARFAMAPSSARGIRPAMTFVLHDKSGAHDWRGTIIAVSAGVDPESGLVRVEGVLNASGETSPFFGQILPGEIVTGASVPGLIAPESALSVTDEGLFIHVVDKEEIAHQVPVKVLATGGGEIVIKGEGIEAGALVIADGNYNLPDGVHVRPNP